MVSVEVCDLRSRPREAPETNQRIYLHPCNKARFKVLGVWEETMKKKAEADQEHFFQFPSNGNASPEGPAQGAP